MFFTLTLTHLDPNIPQNFSMGYIELKFKPPCPLGRVPHRCG